MIIIKNPLFIMSNYLGEKVVIGSIKTKYRTRLKSPNFKMLIKLMRYQFIEHFHLSNILHMAKNYCSSETKCLIYFSDNLKLILHNKHFQFFIVKNALTSSTFFFLNAFILTMKLLQPLLYSLITCGPI